MTECGPNALGDHIIVGSVFSHRISERGQDALKTVGNVTTRHTGRPGSSMAQVRTRIACTSTAARSMSRVEEIHEAGANPRCREKRETRVCHG
jgi:hypothetical protein